MVGTKRPIESKSERRTRRRIRKSTIEFKDDKEIIASGNSMSMTSSPHSAATDDEASPKVKSGMLLKRLESLTDVAWTHVLPVVRRHTHVTDRLEKLYEMWEKYSSEHPGAPPNISKSNFIRRIIKIATKDCLPLNEKIETISKLSKRLLCGLSKQYINLYNFVINSPQSKNRYIVYRGDIWRGRQVTGKGQRFEISGFLSTSLSLDKALEFGTYMEDDSTFLFEIMLPSRFPIAILSSEEYEVILPPMLTLVVDDVVIVEIKRVDSFMGREDTIIQKTIKAHIENWEYIKTFMNHSRHMNYLRAETLKILKEYDKKGTKEKEQPDIRHFVKNLRRIIHRDGKIKTKIQEEDEIPDKITAFEKAAVALPFPTVANTGGTGNRETNINLDAYKTITTMWKRTEFKKDETWYVYDKIHRLSGPAFISWYANGILKNEIWYVDGQISRVDGPAVTRYDTSGTKIEEEWFIGGLKITGDALIELQSSIDANHAVDNTYWEDNSLKVRRYTFNGLPHRIGGPAIIEYGINTKKNGEWWVVGGKYHRDDGPAYIGYDDDGNITTTKWYIEGRPLYK